VGKGSEAAEVVDRDGGDLVTGGSYAYAFELGEVAKLVSVRQVVEEDTKDVGLASAVGIVESGCSTGNVTVASAVDNKIDWFELCACGVAWPFART
jgi:hypothetical protein